MEAALAEKGVNQPEGEVQVMEVIMDAFDIPWRLKKALEKREGMKGYFEKEGFTGDL